MEGKKAYRLWFAQRITAALILVILAMHIYQVHYIELGKPILFAGVAVRLKDIFFLVLDFSLLFLGLFHGLNGIRMVLLDFDFLSKYERTISRILLIVGIIFFIIGVKGLWGFIIR